MTAGQGRDRAGFGYYKHFKRPDGLVFPPPVAVDAWWPKNWIKTYCSATGAGGEMDWMSFLVNVSSPHLGRAT